MQSTLDMALVNDPLEQALLVNVAPVHPVTKGVLGHDPVDVSWMLLPKPEDPGNCLQSKGCVSKPHERSQQCLMVMQAQGSSCSQAPACKGIVLWHCKSKNF